ncbi:peptidoglycan-associated lipoprotein Pal [Cognatishimia activa]|uniref:Peptidoglycan-associated lipoprotein n=1 Tax=Cognatishimia activa TaxID=1715691 RepID=A0A0P1ISK9_9RHOB|nr:peptidoglycan-associated lipoprotein Pal [Cognatishimia activa]CUI69760.1 Minor outer membrane protein Omp16 [Cognatishimia activa]CUK26543.1 Minor outer membrane protein Omp16 [Cognatishimia activa]
MKSILGKSALLVAFVALSACTNPNGLGGGFGGGAGAGANGFEPGSVSDPTSPAYFQQAIGDRVLFEVDQSTLTNAGRATLTAQADWLITNADYMAIIEGHADEQGTREYNLALGARRANAVKEFLLSQGIPSSRLRTVTFGKERPIEICSNEACYSQNRRAVTVISAGLTS